MTEGQTFKCRSAKWSVFAAVAPSSFSQQKTKNHSSLSLPPSFLFSFPKTEKTQSLPLLDSEATAGLAVEVATTTTQSIPALGLVGQKKSPVITSHIKNIQKHSETTQSYQWQECVLKPKAPELSPKVKICLASRP